MGRVGKRQSLMKGLALAFAGLIAPTASAGEIPSSCTGAEAARAIYIHKQLQSPCGSDAAMGGIFSGGVIAQQRRAQAEEQALARDRIATLGRICVGDPLATERLGEAYRVALRLNLYEDAAGIAALRSSTVKAQGSPAPLVP